MGALLGLFWLAGCSPAPVTPEPSLTLPTAETAVLVTVPPEPSPVPSSTASQEPLPPTRTPLPDPTETPIIAVLPPGPTETPQLVETPTSLPPTPTFAAYGVMQIIGYSVEQRPIESYRFGYGIHEIVLVGGIHGGYEWNTILLSYQLIDFFQANPQRIPSNVTLIIIPSANPDGQFLITGKEGRFVPEDVTGSTAPGRFNANGVDLNRNWDCDWSPVGVWREQEVSGGERPFSEPESESLAQFLIGIRPNLVIFYHSAADGLYNGNCSPDVALSQPFLEQYSIASGYPAYDKFTAYPITGDASDWLDLQGIPSFTVELKTQNRTEFEMNLTGVLAVIQQVSQR